VSKSESGDVNRHIARCTSPVYVFWQCELTVVWLRATEMQIRPPCWTYGLGGLSVILRCHHYVILHLPTWSSSVLLCECNYITVVVL